MPAGLPAGRGQQPVDEEEGVRTMVVGGLVRAGGVAGSLQSLAQHESAASSGEGTSASVCWCFWMAASTEAGRPRRA